MTTNTTHAHHVAQAIAANNSAREYGTVSHYVVTPTEPDGDIVAYRFGTADATLDFVCDTLAGEYGYDDVDIDGTRANGYCTSVIQRRRAHGANPCNGHLIATVEIVSVVS